MRVKFGGFQIGLGEWGGEGREAHKKGTRFVERLVTHTHTNIDMTVMIMMMMTRKHATD